MLHVNLGLTKPLRYATKIDGAGQGRNETQRRIRRGVLLFLLAENIPAGGTATPKAAQILAAPPGRVA